jgi:hypothetical protein
MIVRASRAHRLLYTCFNPLLSFTASTQVIAEQKESKKIKQVWLH